MKPFFPDGLSFVKASHQSPYGEIRSEWQKDAKALIWNITIPSNSSALVSIPAESAAQLTESGKAVGQSEGITCIDAEDGIVKMEVASGNYQFKVMIKNN